MPLDPLAPYISPILGYMLTCSSDIGLFYRLFFKTITMKPPHHIPLCSSNLKRYRGKLHRSQLSFPLALTFLNKSAILGWVQLTDKAEYIRRYTTTETLEGRSTVCICFAGLSISNNCNMF